MGLHTRSMVQGEETARLRSYQDGWGNRVGTGCCGPIGNPGGAAADRAEETARGARLWRLSVLNEELTTQGLSRTAQLRQEVSRGSWGRRDAGVNRDPSGTDPGASLQDTVLAKPHNPGFSFILAHSLPSAELQCRESLP